MFYGQLMATCQILWFEDEASLDALKQKNPVIQSLVRECKITHSILNR